MNKVHKPALPLGAFILLLAGLSAIGPFGIDTYLPSVPDISKNLATPIHEVEVTISYFLFGFGIGVFIGGPLTDSFGRKPIAVAGAFIFFVGSMLLVFTNDIEHFKMFRLLQAIGGGFLMVVPNSVVRDYYDGRENARMMSLIESVRMVAPIVAPIVGSILVSFYSWKSVFIFLAGYSFLLFLVALLFMKESSLNIRGINKNTHKLLIADYKAILGSGSSMALVMSITMCVAAMFSFLTDSAFLYMEYFKIPKNMFPMAFGANVILIIITSRLNAKLVRKIEPMKIMVAGVFIQLASTFLFLIHSLFFEPKLYFVMPLIIITVGTLGLVTGNGMSTYLQGFRERSGSASSVFGILNFSVGAGMGALVSSLHNGQIYILSAVMFSCILASFIFLMINRILCKKA